MQTPSTEREDDRVLVPGERLIIVGVDGVYRTWEIAAVQLTRWARKHESEFTVTLEDTGIRPRILDIYSVCEHEQWIADDVLQLLTPGLKVNRIEYCTECSRAQLVGQFRKSCQHMTFEPSCKDCQGATREPE